MALKYSELLRQHPSNPVLPGADSGTTNKDWSNNYHSFESITVRSSVDSNGRFRAQFEPWFFPEYEDNVVRGEQSCYPPNYRVWKFGSEACIRDWFHTEVINLVLAGWSKQPIVLHQSQVLPLDHRSSETVDDFYTLQLNAEHSVPFLIGEYKKFMLRPEEWQGGSLKKESQLKLGRELRGYSIKYQCPQGYCFDGQVCIIWQFRAMQKKDMESRRCPIDIWVLPRNFSLTTYRYALDRLFSQAFRRCQGSLAVPSLTIANHTPETRPFFSGEPLFRVPGNQGLVNFSQYGYIRTIDPNYGAFFWKHNGADMVVNEQRVYDTRPLWRPA